MSQYLQFFVRKNDVFTPIGCFCGSSSIMYVFHSYSYNFPYEAISPLTIRNLKDIINEVSTLIETKKNDNQKAEDEKKLVAQFNNSAEEKIETISTINELITEREEAIAGYEKVKAILETYIDIIETIRYEDGFDCDNFMYFGIEVGMNPTIEDIAK